MSPELEAFQSIRRDLRKTVNRKIVKLNEAMQRLVTDKTITAGSVALDEKTDILDVRFTPIAPVRQIAIKPVFV